MTRLTAVKANRWREAVAHETTMAVAYRRKFSWWSPCAAALTSSTGETNGHQ